MTFEQFAAIETITKDDFRLHRDAMLSRKFGPQDIKDSKNQGFSGMVITPHAGELSSIMGLEKINLEDRIEINTLVSQKFKQRLRIPAMLRGTT